MSKDEPTELCERVAALEARVNGGPGQAAICKIHSAAVEDVKHRLTALEHTVADGFAKLNAKFQFWAGGLAALMVIVNLAAPILRDAAVKLLKGP